MQELPCELLEVYASLFVQRSDQYAVQQRDGSYWRVAEPLTVSHLTAHLAGRWTLGSYVLDALSRCSFAVFDADGEDGLERLALLSEKLLKEGVPTLLEASRRGGHLWVHLVEPTPAHLDSKVAVAVCSSHRSGVVSQTGLAPAWWVWITDPLAARNASAESRVVSLPRVLKLGGVGTSWKNNRGVL